MNKLLDAFNGGTVEQQTRRKKGLMIIAATSALLILATLILLIGTIVALITGNTSANNEWSEDPTDYIPGSFDSAYLYEGNLLLLDDNHPYRGSASVVYFANHASRPKNDLGKEIYTLCDQTTFCGTAETVTAFHKMVGDFYEQSDNDDDLIVDRAYIKNVAQADTRFNTGTVIALTYYADFQTDRDPTNEPSIEENPDYTWIFNHAHEYGFINVEGNIFRYVGVPHATYMKTKNLSLSAYLEKLCEDTSYKKSMAISAGGADYRVYYVAADADVYVPDHGNYELSGTNLGGYIVTVHVTD